jgi:lysophospholipase L1-like esterase
MGLTNPRCLGLKIGLQESMHLKGEILNRKIKTIGMTAFGVMSLINMGIVQGQQQGGGFRFNNGDVVVWVGNTFVERAQRFGYVETLLELEAGRQGAKQVVFRNLGWSGDTVWCEARSYFGPPQEGFERLQKGIGEIKPTVIFSCYGGAEAMERWKEGESEDEALKRFAEGYSRLLGMMAAAAGDGLREVVLVSPTPLENLGEPLPDQVKNNQRLGRYRDEIAKLAQSSLGKNVKLRFVDLFKEMGGDGGSGSVVDNPLTNNGIHYTEAGYRVVAGKLVKALGMEAIPLVEGEAEIEKLRLAVVEKNRLFFHRWRPANETYLFLFRKHEQGQNAKEIPMFDPLVKAKEKEIVDLKERATEVLRKR